MGWASGSSLMSDVIASVKKEVRDKDARTRLYIGLIEAFEEHDCDTLEECLGEDDAFDVALKEVTMEANDGWR